MQRPLFIAIVASAVLVAPTIGSAQNVSMDVLVDGSDSLTVSAGEVTLDLQIRVGTDIALDGVQFALQGSSPELFAFAEPVLTVGSPFTPGELAHGGADDGELISNEPLILLFTFSESHPPSSFPSVVLTIRVRSVGNLSAGTYTFTTGGDEHHIWTSSPDTGAFTSIGTFTLTVTGEGAPGGPGGPGDPGDPGDDNGDEPPGDDEPGNGEDDPTDPTDPGDDPPNGEDDDPGPGNGDAPPVDPGDEDPPSDDPGDTDPPSPPPTRPGCGLGASSAAASLAGLLGLAFVGRSRARTRRRAGSS